MKEHVYWSKKKIVFYGVSCAEDLTALWRKFSGLDPLKLHPILNYIFFDYTVFSADAKQLFGYQYSRIPASDASYTLSSLLSTFSSSRYFFGTCMVRFNRIWIVISSFSCSLILLLSRVSWQQTFFMRCHFPTYSNMFGERSI